MVLGIAVWAEGDPKERASEFAQKHKLTFPVLVDADNKVVEQFGVEGVPTTFVIGRDGMVRKVIVGAQIEAIKKAVTDALE